jgi:hypothetical protein
LVISNEALLRDQYNSGILSRPENTKRGRDRPRLIWKETIKIDFEGMEYIQRACFG